MDYAATTSNELSHAPPKPPVKPLLDQLHERCSFPRTHELKDDMCNICQEPFLSLNNPEIPIKLPCSHVYGLGCILNWLNPLSEQRHDSCPMCRQPILGPSKPYDRYIDIMRRFLPEVERYPGNPDHLDLTNVHAAWLAQAERLWLNICEELMRVLEETHLASDWLLKVEPLVKVVVNFVSVRNFIGAIRDISDSRTTGEVWWLRPLACYVRLPLVLFMNHIDQHPAGISVWTGDHDSLFPTPTEADYLRVAGYLRKVRESHARLSYRTHAYLEHAEV